MEIFICYQDYAYEGFGAPEAVFYTLEEAEAYIKGDYLSWGIAILKLPELPKV